MVQSRSILGLGLPSSAGGNCEWPLPVHWNGLFVSNQGAFSVSRISGWSALMYLNIDWCVGFDMLNWHSRVEQLRHCWYPTNCFGLCYPFLSSVKYHYYVDPVSCEAGFLLMMLLLWLSSAFTSHSSSAIQWQCHQLSAVTAVHSPAWSVGSQWQYGTQGHMSVNARPTLISTGCTVVLVGPD